MMKCIDGLYSSIHCRENLGAALWAAARGKSTKPEIKRFLPNADAELSSIAQQFQSGNLQFQAYRQFQVQDTKTRIIQAPSFRDRVIHHAIIRVTGPVFERSAIHHSYACRSGKGQHAALRQLRYWVRRSHWYGKIDVSRYYDSVPHDRLMVLLRQRFREPQLTGLFERLLMSYQSRPGHGLPIGALTSQYLGNFYLDEFDRQLLTARSTRHYMRYMDDMLMLGTREQMVAAQASSEQILAALGLESKHGGEWNRAAQGIPYLGFIVYPDRLRLNAAGRKRLRRQWARLRRQYREGLLTEQDVQSRATAVLLMRKDRMMWAGGAVCYRFWTVTVSTVGMHRNANRVMRGGSWNNSARNCRSAYRNRRNPGNRNRNQGFQVGLFPGTRTVILLRDSAESDARGTTCIPVLRWRCSAWSKPRVSPWLVRVHAVYRSGTRVS